MLNRRNAAWAFAIWMLYFPVWAQAKLAATAQTKMQPTSMGSIQFAPVEAREYPVTNYDSPGAGHNKYGFEGGSVIKEGSLYHLFVAEETGDPFGERMRMALWTSHDAIHWKRISTLFETNGLSAGPRHSVWAPIPIFDRLENRWDLFYVAYAPPPGYSEGRIWRAVSQTPGREGLGGPYKDTGVILQRDKSSQPWEGSQGTDSFYPFQANGKWYAFYGSHESEGPQYWHVGLAIAPKPNGPWKRMPAGNPIPIEPTFIENPIVTRVGDLYVAVYNSIESDHTEVQSVGYSYSHDGLHWISGKRIAVRPSGPGNWSSEIRTPLGLVAEGHGVFTLLYTGMLRNKNFFAVGMVRLKASIASP